MRNLFRTLGLRAPEELALEGKEIDQCLIDHRFARSQFYPADG